MHEWLLNECLERLTQRALAIIASNLPEDKQESAFCELAIASLAVLVWYELEQEWMARRSLPNAREATPE